MYGSVDRWVDNGSWIDECIEDETRMNGWICGLMVGCMDGLTGEYIRADKNA